MRYRKKPIEVDAWLFNDPSKWSEFEALNPRKIRAIGNFKHENDVLGLNIHTLEGIMFAEIGDWIIRGVKGEFYPCKPDIFEATYEPAPPPDQQQGGRDG